MSSVAQVNVSISNNRVSAANALSMLKPIRKLPVINRALFQGNEELLLSDKLAFSHRYDHIFVDDLHSDGVFNGIASKTGSEVLVRREVSTTMQTNGRGHIHSNSRLSIQLAKIKIAWDFILDKTLKNHELRIRYLYANAGDLFVRPGSTKKSNEKMSEAEFGITCEQLRGLLKDLILPRAKFSFCERAPHMNQKFKGHTLNTFEDYILLYKRKDLYGKDMREFVYDLTNRTMGSEVFKAIEKDVMDVAGLEYENRCVETEAKIRPGRSTGSIKAMVSQINQTNLMNRFRETGMNHHRERIYGKAARNGKPAEGVVKMIKVTANEWGFPGYIGLCVGHPMLLEKETVKPNLEANDGQILIDLISSASEHATKKEIKEEWERKKAEKRAKPVAPKVITTKDSGVSVVSVSDLLVMSCHNDKLTALLLCLDRS